MLSQTNAAMSDFGVWLIPLTETCSQDSATPASQKQSPSSRHQNAEEGCRTTEEMGSISSSRSSEEGEGKPAIAGLAISLRGNAIGNKGCFYRKIGHMILKYSFSALAYL